MMNTPDSITAPTVHLLALVAQGDAQAHEALIRHVGDRLLRLTRRMLRGYPHLLRWEQTDDIFQTAVLRLYRSLGSVKPQSAEHFWNLATTQIRRTLIDLVRHHFGPQGQAAHHHSDGAIAGGDEDAEFLPPSGRASQEPETLEGWTAFHEAIERLPDGEREVFQLVWYAGLSQQEAAQTLNVSLPTVQRRWYAAQVTLFRVLQGQSPLTEE
jgi:RNA polymerase sigma-70 factor (ECF subfamily)